MPQWEVTVDWNMIVEAEDEGDALLQALKEFSFTEEANVEELETQS